MYLAHLFKIFKGITPAISLLTNSIKKRVYFLPQNIIDNYKFNPSNLLVSNKQILKGLKKRKITPTNSNSFTESTLFLNTGFVYFIQNYYTINSLVLNSILSFQSFLKNTLINLLDTFKRTFGDGFLYLRGLFILFFIDACLTDDEPIWEPVEWSLVQSWIMFIFLFAWIAENLISSRFGSYTGRDKRIWFSWYKTFWLIEGWYIMSLGAACLFVMVPFYYELTYSVSFVVSWWNWYSRIFFFKFVSLYTIVLFLAYLLQINLRWFNWKKSMFIILFINFFLSYLLYVHFFMAFFGYFTDVSWYHKTRLVDYIQLSHEPNRWSWGDKKRDHFSYHRTSTVFWFKNDGPFAASFLFFHFFIFLSLFFLYLYWITLIRKVYATQEVTYTYTTYCVSALKQFFYFFLFLYLFVFLSFIFNYWRLPIEFFWISNPKSWFSNLFLICSDYPSFLLEILSIL